MNESSEELQAYWNIDVNNSEMADSIELQNLQDDTFEDTNDEDVEVEVKQPGKNGTTPLINQLSNESIQQRRRKRTISEANERRLKRRKERERRRLKQLEEDEIRRRERRKRQRQNQAKTIGQKSVYDAESKREREVNMLNELDRKEFEREMNKVLTDGNLDDIKEIVTAHKLTKCKTNSLEKSLEVSFKLKRLADTNYPDAEDFIALAHKVEDFSISLLEPLKSDDMKRAIFEGEDFERISEKSILFQQKKFISHPVVYNLLLKRWSGIFYHLRLTSWFDINFFKWLFLTIWTVFDIVLFPFVFLVLYIVHFIIDLSKKECHAIVLMSACNLDSLEDMQDLSSACFAILRPPHSTMITDQDKIKKNSDVAQPYDEESFLNCLRSARNMFRVMEETSHTKTDKLLIVMTDDHVDASVRELTNLIQSFKNDQIRIVSVGFGVHPEIKELQTIATKQQNVFLYHGNIKLGEIVRKMLEALRGQDVFDHYVQYFNTPYFIFLRDTISYLVLLGLHFALCLQPSTIHFTVLEWIIMTFLIGRLLMEIYQIVSEKQLMDKFSKQSRNYEKFVLGKSQFLKSMSGKSAKEMDEFMIYEKTTIFQVGRKIMSRYFSDWWNAIDLVTLLVYIIILILRSITWAEHSTVPNNRLLAVAGYFYGLNTMFLTLRLFGNIMESTKNTGSIQIALFQIIGAVVAIFGQFLAATVAFSLAITKVFVAEISYTAGRNFTSHGFCKDDSGGGGFKCWWESLRNLLWSLLGDPELEPLNSSDGPSDTLAKVLYGIYLIMAVVMLMNMMIALLSNTYQQVEDNAFYEWSYRRATTIRTYINYHPVPVPFNIISFTLMLLYRVYLGCLKCCTKDKGYLRKFGHARDHATFFDCLVLDLQAEYFSKHGYAFPLAESNKMDWVFKETEGNRQLIGHIANQVFTDKSKRQQRQADDSVDNTLNIWNSRGITIKGHQLTYEECYCQECSTSVNAETRYHGAMYMQPLTQNFPGFEVLIQESIERRLIVIGVVPVTWHSPHVVAGSQSNSAGFHVDEGKIFDHNNQKIGIECEGAMAHRGDLIGCQIIFEHSHDEMIPVQFTLNGQLIGEAIVKQGQHFYPFIAIGWEGIVLLFKKTTATAYPAQKVIPQKNEMHQLLQQLCEKVDNLQTHYEKRQLEMMQSMKNLEKRMDALYQQHILHRNSGHTETTLMNSKDYEKETDQGNTRQKPLQETTHSALVKDDETIF